MTKTDIRKAIFSWIPFAFLVTVFSLVTYGAVQQSIRSAANDPQIQLAEDTANYLATTGADPKNLVGVPIDIRKSIAPFGNIYNENKVVLAGGGSVDGAPPVPPQGVFDYVKAHGEDRFTWEPSKGVRVAAVMTVASSTKVEYVLLGRSLREVENREHSLLMMMLLAWAASLIVAFGYTLLMVRTRHHE